MVVSQFKVNFLSMGTPNQHHLPAGQWLIQYDPAEITGPEVLSYLVQNAVLPPGQDKKTGYREIFIDRKGKISPACHPQIRPVHPAGNQYLLPDIKKILLCFPYLLSDKRWQTISLTSSSIFLGSSLANHGFDVEVEKLQLPAAGIEHNMEDYDLVGFTLFEDLLPEFRTFLQFFSSGERFQPGRAQAPQATRGVREAGEAGTPPGTALPGPGNASPGIILAAGGPLVTLNPLEAAYFLPRINLFIRGEAELVLPGILKAVQSGDWQQFFAYRGVLFQWPGLLVISGLGEINRPHDFTGFDFNLGFLAREHMENGLEINFSRGCRRSCLFCSKVQGKGYRELPLDKVANLLENFSSVLEKQHVTAERAELARSININDDDILQDQCYAREVLSLVKKYGFKLWGIQTSLTSFFNFPKEHEAPGDPLRRDLVELVSDPGLFIKEHPLVWFGTDTFLVRRGKRLGKAIPSPALIEELVQVMEERDILNYHYWISSDYASSFEELVEELFFIHRLAQRYKTFSIIAHAPFVVPYSTSPLYEFLDRSPIYRDNIKYKAMLRPTAPGTGFILPLTQRVETPFSQLNRLLNNEQFGGKPGFFDCLKQQDYLEAFIVMYNFLKEERLLCESVLQDRAKQALAQRLQETEKKVADYIALLMGAP